MPAKRHSLLHYIWRSLQLCFLALFAQALVCAWLVYHQGQIKAPGKADAAVILGAAAWGKNPSPVFRERIRHGIHLYQQGRVAKLIFTGGSPKAGFMTEAEVGRRYAIAHGVPKEVILFENRSRDTYQNLANLLPILKENELDSLIIISDPYHLARAMVMAKSLGLNAYSEPTPTSRYQGKNEYRFFADEVGALMLFQWWQLSAWLGASNETNKPLQ